MNPYLTRALREQDEARTALVDAPDQPECYEAHTIPELRTAIATRNDGRDPEGETYIKPDGSNKPDLIAALEADDAAAAAAENKES